MITRRYKLSLPPQVLALGGMSIFIGTYAALAEDQPEVWIASLLGIIPFCFISGTQTDPEKKRFRTFVEFLSPKA